MNVMEQLWRKNVEENSLVGEEEEDGEEGCFGDACIALDDYSFTFRRWEFFLRVLESRREENSFKYFKVLPANMGHK